MAVFYALLTIVKSLITSLGPGHPFARRGVARQVCAKMATSDVAHGACQVEEQAVVATSNGAAREDLSREREGYECEFVQPPPEALLQTECSICLQILREPHIISCCGHNFCRSCIGRIKAGGKRCPLCNEANFSLMHNKGLERTLKNLEVRCPHSTCSKSGCDWIGKLEALDNHLNMDPEPEKQLEGCSFSKVECFHRCGEYFQRHLITKHQWDECLKRPYSCDYCREYESTFDDVTNNHWPECKCYPLSCPNHCTPYAFERQVLEHHVTKDCPLTVVNCDFHYAGCEVQLPRKDMPAHVKENFSHLSLLAAMNQKLARENQALTKKLLEKGEHITTLEEASALMREEIDRLKIKQNEAASKSEVEELKLEIVKKQEQAELKAEIDRERLTLEVAELTRKQEQYEAKCEGLINVVPVEVTMAEFQGHKKHNGYWYSQPFYTHQEGYRMCLCVDANGCGHCRGTHLSVSVFLIPGMFDDHLKWPFQGVVTIQLLNQKQDQGHHEKTITFNDNTPLASAGRVIKGERGEAWGVRRFLSHFELIPTEKHQYLEHGCLHFRIAKVETV